MTNLIYQGKINRQFWGKLIRQSTGKNMTKLCLQFVTWGGEQFNSKLSNIVTFFHYDIRAG